MKVNWDISTVYKSKALKKCLEFAADNGALFGASAAVGFSVIRPLVIMNTPKTDKENREIASSKSIASSIIGFLLLLGITTPLSKSIKKIDKNPQKYLSEETIKKLKLKFQKPENSKEYTFATQLFKLGIGAVAAIPKAVLVAIGMPYIMNIFQKDTQKKENNINKNTSFKAKPTEYLAKKIGNILNKGKMQKFVEKFKDTNFPMHITAFTDILATGAFIHQTKQSKKIADERKNALIYNSAISTGLCIAGGYGIDKLLDKPTEKFISKFRTVNFGQKNLEKQIQGIRIAKPILILGAIYYIFIPLISTFLAEKADAMNHNKTAK